MVAITAVVPNDDRIGADSGIRIATGQTIREALEELLDWVIGNGDKDAAEKARQAVMDKGRLTDDEIEKLLDESPLINTWNVVAAYPFMRTKGDE